MKAQDIIDNFGIEEKNHCLRCICMLHLLFLCHVFLAEASIRAWIHDGNVDLLAVAGKLKNAGKVLFRLPLCANIVLVSRLLSFSAAARIHGD